MWSMSLDEIKEKTKEKSVISERSINLMKTSKKHA